MVKIENISRHVLLTGAGFTHNFGVPLSKDIWAKIFNNEKVQCEKRIRELLLYNFDFEDVYNLVFSNGYNDNEKDAIKEAVLFAYENIDETIRAYRFSGNGTFAVNLHRVQNLIHRFAGKDQKGFFFTLNQDLFIERQYYNGMKPTMPGIRLKGDYFSANFKQKISPSYFIQLPDEDEVKEKSPSYFQNDAFFYIKLHGSYNWISSDGTQKLVIGRNKQSQIISEPLLAFFFKVFKHVLSQGNIKLLVIGYSFSDDHINDIIVDAIKQFNLKLFVLTPQPVSEFKASLLNKNKKNGDILWTGLKGYFPNKLVELFPGNQQNQTHEANAIYSYYFS